MVDTLEQCQVAGTSYAKALGQAGLTILQEVKEIDGKCLGEAWERARSCRAVKWEGGSWEGQWGIIAGFGTREGGMWHGVTGSFLLLQCQDSIGGTGVEAKGPFRECG